MRAIIFNLIIFSLLIILPRVNLADVTSTNGLLIFLDDSERDNGGYEFGALSDNLLSSLAIEEAGPVIASASLLVNIRGAAKPKSTNPQKLAEFFNKLESLTGEEYFNQTQKEFKEEKRAILSVVSFNDEVAKKWIIKEINSSLYLLIPKKYLKSKGIEEKKVMAFDKALLNKNNRTITLTEQALGFKVNHMKTVKINNVKLTLPEPQNADYFVSSLYDIFVINNEYPEDKKKDIPTWAIYINGHGMIKESVAHLRLDQFIVFLDFLETKIRTKLLYYLSCYAAGLTSEEIYKDAESDINKTYSFAIITQALTDASAESIAIKFELVGGKLKPKVTGGFSNFFNVISASDIIDYIKLVTPMIAFDKYNVIQSISNWPQIRFPGLPWFSVIDMDRIISIGSILAKTRKVPLNISAFFAKRGKKAEPYGILLYAEKIPFELLINTARIPAIISMMPGNAMHHIQKISSKIHTVDDIIDSFLTIFELYPHKIFIIDQLDAPFTEAMTKMFGNKEGMLSDIVIDLTEHEDNIYFSYKNNVYKLVIKPEQANEPILADAKSKIGYEKIIDQFIKQSKLSFDVVQAKAQKMFAQAISFDQAKENIIELLDAMPDNTILRIPKIIGQKCPPEDITCWWNMLISLTNYSAFGRNKILWVDEIEVCREYGCYVDYRDIIIDAVKDYVDLFYKDHDGNNPQNVSKNMFNALMEDYIPVYEKMFDYFKQHKTIDETLEDKIKMIEKKSVHELLTPETIAKIQESIIARRSSIKKDQKTLDVHSLIQLSSTLGALQAVL